MPVKSLVLTILFFVSFLAPLHAEEFSVATTDKQVNLNVRHTGSSLSYKVLDSLGNTIFPESSFTLENALEQEKSSPISFKVPQLGLYTAEITVYDLVGNSAQANCTIEVKAEVTNISVQLKPIARKPIPAKVAGAQTATTNALAQNYPGSVYGVSIDNPWGKNNNYANYIGTANLFIDYSLQPSRNTFSNIAAPTVQLTANLNNGTEQVAYGWAQPINSKIQVQVYENYLPTVKKHNCSPWSIYYKQCVNENILCGLPLFWLVCSVTVPIPYADINWKYAGYTLASANESRVSLVNSTGQEVAFVNSPKDAAFKLTTKKTVFTEILRARNFLTYSGNFAGRVFSFTTANESAPLAAISSFVAPEAGCNNSFCLVLGVDYTNQWVNSAGKYTSWAGWPADVGGKSCGAASSVMVTNYYSKLKRTGPELQSYIFKDNSEFLKNKKCNRGGAFAVTAYDSSCNQSSTDSIRNYLGQYGLTTKWHKPLRSSVESFTKDIIIPGLKQNHTFILSYTQPIGHILLITGVTYSGQLVVNDPYRDFQNNYIKGKYDYSGKGAIYQLYPNNNYTLNYILEVWPQ